MSFNRRFDTMVHTRFNKEKNIREKTPHNDIVSFRCMILPRWSCLPTGLVYTRMTK